MFVHVCVYILRLVYIHQSEEFHKTHQFVVQFPAQVINAPTSVPGGVFLLLYQHDKRRICLCSYLYFEVK